MRDIYARKGLAKGEHILDHMGSERLASNIFRAAQTEAKLRREQIQGKAAASQAHFDVGRKVRQTIAELGGTMPEELPTPPESIQQAWAREWRRELGAEQQDLFGKQSGGEEAKP
jgi:DNA-damage-inducible protein D